jgi:hypothetical protein
MIWYCASSPHYQPGFWWALSDEGGKEKLMAFTGAMLQEKPGVALTLDVYPIPIECKSKAACAGGIGAECTAGYTGILCSQCQIEPEVYFNWNGECNACPTKSAAWVSAILIGLGLIALSIFLFRENASVGDGDNKETPSSAKKSERSRGRSCFRLLARKSGRIMAKAKIVLSYLQV